MRQEKRANRIALALGVAMAGTSTAMLWQIRAVTAACEYDCEECVCWRMVQSGPDLKAKWTDSSSCLIEHWHDKTSESEICDNQGLAAPSREYHLATNDEDCTVGAQNNVVFQAKNCDPYGTMKTGHCCRACSTQGE